MQCFIRDILARQRLSRSSPTKSKITERTKCCWQTLEAHLDAELAGSVRRRIRPFSHCQCGSMHLNDCTTFVAAACDKGTCSPTGQTYTRWMRV